MSNADSRHSTRTTEGADLGLASQKHFFIPSFKLGHPQKAFLNSKPGVQPAMSHSEYLHPIGSCQLVWHCALSFRTVCLICHHAFLQILSNTDTPWLHLWLAPFRMDFGAKNQPVFRHLAGISGEVNVLWTTRVPEDFKKSKDSCSAFNLVSLLCYV